MFFPFFHATRYIPDSRSFFDAKAAEEVDLGVLERGEVFEGSLEWKMDGKNVFFVWGKT